MATSWRKASEIYPDIEVSRCLLAELPVRFGFDKAHKMLDIFIGVKLMPLGFLNLAVALCR